MPQIYFLSWRQNKRNSCQSTCLLVPQKSFKGVIKYETNPNNALLREIPENGHTFAASLILPKWVKTSFLVTFPSCPRLLGLRAFWTVCNASSFMDDKQRQHNIAFRKQHLLRKQTSHFSESTRRVVFFLRHPPHFKKQWLCAASAKSSLETRRFPQISGVPQIECSTICSTMAFQEFPNKLGILDFRREKNDTSILWRIWSLKFIGAKSVGWNNL